MLLQSRPPDEPDFAVAEAARTRSRAQHAVPIAEAEERFLTRWSLVEGSFAARAVQSKLRGNGDQAEQAADGRKPRSFLDEWMETRRKQRRDLGEDSDEDDQ